MNIHGNNLNQAYDTAIAISQHPAGTTITSRLADIHASMAKLNDRMSRLADHVTGGVLSQNPNAVSGPRPQEPHLSMRVADMSDCLAQIETDLSRLESAIGREARGT